MALHHAAFLSGCDRIHENLSFVGRRGKGYFQFGIFDELEAEPPVIFDDVPFSEDFSSPGDAGFTFNPFGTDTAERGQFEIGTHREPQT